MQILFCTFRIHKYQRDCKNTKIIPIHKINKISIFQKNQPPRVPQDELEVIEQHGPDDAQPPAGHRGIDEACGLDFTYDFCSHKKKMIKLVLA